MNIAAEPRAWAIIEVQPVRLRWLEPPHQPPMEPLTPDPYQEILLAHGIIDWRRAE